MANDPVERKTLRVAENAHQRKHSVGARDDSVVREKKRIYDHESYLRKKARLDADPVEKERARGERAKGHRERMTCPESKEKISISNKRS